jgi:hypothetical protein
MNSRLTALLLLVAVVIYRVGAGFASTDVAAQLSGFAPFAALVLGAAVLAPQARLAWVPAAAFLLSDVILNVVVYKTSAFHPYLFLTVGFYTVLFLAGRPLARRASLAVPYLGSTVLAVVAFHLLANTVSWAMNPLYAKSAAGLVQAHTTGLPGLLPSWAFLLKSLAGNLGFAALFLVALAPARQSLPSAAPARA